MRWKLNSNAVNVHPTEQAYRWKYVSIVASVAALISTHVMMNEIIGLTEEAWPVSSVRDILSGILALPVKL